MNEKPATAAACGLFSCHLCGLVSKAAGTGGAARCPRCSARLHFRKPNGTSRAWALLIAAYNAGPTLLAQKNFDVTKMPASTRDYIERVTNLHDALLAEQARAEQAAKLLAQRTTAPRVASL